MNYFEFYGIPISFLVDEELLKKKYIEFSRKYHPDYFINESERKQSEILELSTLNTKAFQALSDFDKRMKYILELKNLIFEGERYELPPTFLMEMMDINEGLIELKMEPDQKKIADFELTISNLQTDLFNEVKSVIDNYNDSTATSEDLKKIKDYYYKKKYLLRIRQSLDTFGAP
jgi:molecular chaperone HscB